VTKKDENSSEGEQEDDTDDQKSESLDSPGGGDDDVIQVDFEAFPFRDEDAERVTHFLKVLFPDAEENGLDLAEISQMIVKQSGIGCVLLPTAEEADDEEEDVFGMISVIDLDAYCQLKDYCRLRMASASKSTKAKFETTLNSSKTGLIICERLINMPIDIALPLYKSLKQDIESASVKYDYFAILSICQRVSASKNSDEIFVNPEDEFWFQLSCANCDFPNQSNGAAEKLAEDDEESVENIRRFILVDADKFNEFLLKLDSRCSN